MRDELGTCLRLIPLAAAALVLACCADAPGQPSPPPEFERVAEEMDCSDTRPGSGYQPCGSYRATVTVVHGEDSCGGFVYENAPDSTGAVWFEVVAAGSDSRPENLTFNWTGFQEPTLGAAIIGAASLPAGPGVTTETCRQGLKTRAVD